MAYIVKQPMGNGHTHLFLAANERVDGKKHPVQRRIYLGVFDAENSELLRSRNAAEPSAEILALLKAKGIGYTGRVAVRRKSSFSGDIAKIIKSGAVLEVGRIELLEYMAQKSGLLPVLLNTLGEHDGRRIFSAAAYECCEGGALCRLEDWAGGTSLSEYELALSNASVSRLCQDIGANTALRNDFFKAWFKACGSPKALVSDTTSISSYAEKLSAVEWGYNRDAEALPQINLNMIYARIRHTPLYYRVIPGSIPDVATLLSTSKTISELGLDLYNFSLDRGFFSVENLLYFHDEKLGYTIGAPLSSKEAEWLLERNKQKLRSFKNTVVFEETTLHHVSDTYRIIRKGKNGKRDKVVNTTAHIYLDKCRRARQEKELVELLHGIMNEFAKCTFADLEEAELWVENIAGKSKKTLLNVRKFRMKAANQEEHYIASADGKFQIGVSERNYAATVKHFGVFMVLNSDPSASGEETLRDNRSRECQEKVFDILKNSTGNDRLKAHSDDSMAGRIFIAFIAVILHKLLENELREAECLKTTSVHKALDLARKIKVAIFNGTRIPYEIPLKTRSLLEKIAPAMLR